MIFNLVNAIRLAGVLLFTTFMCLIFFWGIFLPHALKIKIIRPISGWWARIITHYILGIKVISKGRELIPKNDYNYISVSNHLSFMDILLISGALQTPFLLKSSLMLTPFGWGAYLSGAVFVNRTQFAGHLKIINKVLNISKTRQAMHIFPEGTRSKSGNMLPFKKGTLKMAYKKNLAVLVSGIWGTRHILPKKSIKIKRTFPAILTIAGSVEPEKFPNVDDFLTAVEKKVFLAVSSSKKVFEETCRAI